MTESTAQLSDLSDELLYRERRVLLEGVADLTRRAALHRLLLEQLELELAAQTRLLSEIEELMDLRPQLRLERLDRQLRGRRLQEVAVEILRSRAAERNRRIMRVFYLNKKRDIGWQLSVTDVQRRLREEFPGFELELAALERSLTTLKDNGDLAAQPNTRDAATPTEWRHRRLLYDITPRGERVEELLAELDAMREEASSLQPHRPHRATPRPSPQAWRLIPPRSPQLSNPEPEAIERTGHCRRRPSRRSTAERRCG